MRGPVFRTCSVCGKHGAFAAYVVMSIDQEGDPLDIRDPTCSAMCARKAITDVGGATRSDLRRARREGAR